MVNIIKVSGEMFFRLGIRSVSIDDICRELGMSKKTFYVYFESKDELIEQLLLANVEYMSGKMEELLSFGDFRQLVKAFLKCQEAERNDVRKVPNWSMTSRNTTRVSLPSSRNNASRRRRTISCDTSSWALRRGSCARTLI